MKLEPLNIVCPKCGNPRYMRYLVFDHLTTVKDEYFDVKCINCNTYFRSQDFSGQTLSYKCKKTNGDKIRVMTDEELAIWLTDFVCADYGYAASARIAMYQSGLAEWLKQETGK